MKTRLPIFAAVALVLLSCKSEQAETDGTFNCSLESSPFGTAWKTGDWISVFNGDGGNKAYQYAGATGESSGEFRYHSGESMGVKLPGNFAISPWAENNAVTNSGIFYLDIPESQDIPASRPPMIAASKDENLVFRHICGMVTLRLWGSGSISSVTVNAPGGEKLAGRSVVETADGVPSSVRISSSGASSQLKLRCNIPVKPGASAAECSSLSFFLLPGTYAGGLSFELEDASGAVFELAVPGPLTVVRADELRLEPMKLEFNHPLDITVGEPLPAWSEGYLDIHSINGGRGESFFYIFPDGTTMLVDAAGAPDYEIQGESGSGIYSRPSREYSSGNVIVRYLQHYMPAVAGGRINYFMTSHYHSDHMGSFTKSHAKYGWKAVDKNGKAVTTVDVSSGGFLLNGLPEVGFSFPIDRLIDRGDWDKRASNVWSTGQTRRQNYINFIDWSARTCGTVHEKLAIGHTDQIVLRHKASDYPGFSVRGIAAGGDIWTGSGTSVNTNYVPSAEQCLANIDKWDINENIFSCVFTLSYGKFDMFSGGDIQYTGRGSYSWKDIELPISKVVGKVEVMKACHHSTSNTNSTALLNVLKPDCYVVGVWTQNQPNPATLKRVYAANKDVKIFATNLSGHIISLLAGEGISTSTFLARGGHVVVRVLPGGDQYYMIVLDDSDFEYRVSEVHGPYSCQ